jgi:hypothetical protein
MVSRMKRIKPRTPVPRQQVDFGLAGAVKYGSQPGDLTPHQTGQMIAHFGNYPKSHQLRPVIGCCHHNERTHFRHLPVSGRLAEVYFRTGEHFA